MKLGTLGAEGSKIFNELIHITCQLELTGKQFKIVESPDVENDIPGLARIVNETN